MRATLQAISEALREKPSSFPLGGPLFGGLNLISGFGVLVEDADTHPPTTMVADTRGSEDYSTFGGTPLSTLGDCWKEDIRETPRCFCSAIATSLRPLR